MPGGGADPNMRVAELIVVVALAACSGQQTATQVPATASPGDGQTITVRLSSFAFDPDIIRLTIGEPVRIRFVNDSDKGHDFSAPAFFAASTFPAGTRSPAGGAIEVGAHQTTDVLVVPRVAGNYQFECTHPLHSLFGMTGRVQVTP
jgi:plastocyanin